MIVLVHGSDSFSSLNRAKEIFKNEIEKQGTPETFNEDFSVKDISDLYQILEGQTLFASTKVALIKSLTDNSKFKDSVDKLLERFKTLPDDISVVFWESGKVAANTKFGKFFKAQKSEEVFEEKKKPEVKKFVTDELKKNNLSIDPHALELLLFLTNYDVGYLTGEITKLTLLGKDKITEEDIRIIVPNSSESLIWDLTDAIIESDKDKALTAADNLMKNTSDQFMLIPMIGRQIKIMIQVKLMLNEGAGYGDIARELRMPPFIVNKVAKYAMTANLEKLKRLFMKLVDMDYAIKTGKMDAQIAITLFLSLI